MLAVEYEIAAFSVQGQQNYKESSWNYRKEVPQLLQSWKISLLSNQFFSQRGQLSNISIRVLIFRIKRIEIIMNLKIKISIFSPLTILDSNKENSQLTSREI